MRFVDHLRSLSDEQMVVFLRARPDLMRSVGSGFEWFANMAGTPRSLAQVMVDADYAMITVVEALTLIHPASATDIVEIIGTDDLSGVLDALDRLEKLGIIMIDQPPDGGPSIIRPVGSLVDLFPRPFGLGPSYGELFEEHSHEALEKMVTILGIDAPPDKRVRSELAACCLRTPEGVAALTTAAPPAAVEIMRSLAESGNAFVELDEEVIRSRPGVDDPIGWMLATGVIVPCYYSTAFVPREIVMAYADAGLEPTAAMRPIPLTSVPSLPADSIAAGGIDQANRVLEAAETILEMAQKLELSSLKSGGIGVREVTRISKIVDLSPKDTARILEIMLAAKLLGCVGQRVRFLPLAETWNKLGRSSRWIALVRTWMASSYLASVALAKAVGDTSTIPVGSEVQGAVVPARARRVLINTISEIGDGEAFEADRLVDVVGWKVPNLWGHGAWPPEQVLAWLLEELELLGLIADNSPTPILRTLAVDDIDKMNDLAQQLMGAEQHQFLLQADMSAMALGPLDPAVASALGELANREGSGSAAPTYRFSEVSLRKAFDAGWTADTILEFLGDHALSGIPQPLEYLLADVDRRHGATRVGEAKSVIIAADEAEAVRIAASDKTHSLGLRLVAPTVLTSNKHPVSVIKQLQAEGLFPTLLGHNDAEPRRFNPDRMNAGMEKPERGHDIPSHRLDPTWMFADSSTPEPTAEAIDFGCDDDPYYAPPHLSAAELRFWYDVDTFADAVETLAESEQEIEASDRGGIDPSLLLQDDLLLMVGSHVRVSHVTGSEIVEVEGRVVTVDHLLWIIVDNELQRIPLSELLQAEVVRR